MPTPGVQILESFPINGTHDCTPQCLSLRPITARPQGAAINQGLILNQKSWRCVEHPGTDDYDIHTRLLQCQTGGPDTHSKAKFTQIWNHKSSIANVAPEGYFILQTASSEYPASDYSSTSTMPRFSRRTHEHKKYRLTIILAPWYTVDVKLGLSLSHISIAKVDWRGKENCSWRQSGANCYLMRRLRDHIHTIYDHVHASPDGSVDNCTCLGTPVGSVLQFWCSILMEK
ncbi:hypothetical protein DFP72DRAFT_845663 [Ephemerocybe angulata]|uniref:Uncharacterized protein n=1 Tax=Ephemerocybe angulata TaxID=980116 RepID=A0A8H6I2I0_9AGAR|nr:hypothetical protein DFP72DRAFT_845663 [Tulosesus angulatus]